ncbi:4'-phosphopantetheinyl transferase family protein [Saccharicrinis sp. FJH54]|uniref:4'-phosphopantetheinyl transferase family protein n=1 Tax=Saccharicrinis sp. FJH54 TaxID=3344665 RepID=UPI0035D4837C
MDFELNDAISPVFKSKTSIEITCGNALNFPQNYSSLLSVLSDIEVKHANQFIPQIVKHTYVVSHALLRISLSDKLGIDPSQLRLFQEDFVKPRLENAPYDFNLTHSGEYFAFVISDYEKLKVGIDIEKLDALKDFNSICDAYFHEQERAYFYQHDISKKEREVRFFEIWTRKEAYLKMTGEGLINDLNRINILSYNTQGEASSDNKTVIFTFRNQHLVLSVSMTDDMNINIKTASEQNLNL